MGKQRVVKIGNVTYDNFPTCASLVNLKNHQLSDILGFVRRIGVASLDDLAYYLRAKSLDAVRQLLHRVHFPEEMSEETRTKNVQQVEREQTCALKHDDKNRYMIHLKEIIERGLSRPKGFELGKDVETQLVKQRRAYEKVAQELPKPEPIVIDDVIYDDFLTLEQLMDQPDEVKRYYFEFMNGLGVPATSKQSAYYLQTQNLKAIEEMVAKIQPDVIQKEHNPPHLRAMQHMILREVKDQLEGKITISISELLKKCKRQKLSSRNYCNFYKEATIIMKNSVRELENRNNPNQPVKPVSKAPIKPIYVWKEASADRDYMRTLATMFPHISYGDLQRNLFVDTTESAIRHYFGRWGIPHERVSVKDDAYRQEHDAFVRWASEKLEAPSTKPAKPVGADKLTLPTTDIIAIPGTTKSSARPDRYATSTIYPLGDAGDILKELAPLGERKITIVSITVKGKTSDILRSLYKSEKGAELMRLHRVYISEDIPKDEDDEP